MRNIAPLFLCVFVTFSSWSQVGIGTTNPQATLDVNGTFRVQMRQSDELQAVKVVGVTEDGVYLDLEMDDNIFIKDNVLSVRERTMDVGDIPVISAPAVHNMNMILFPGGANRNKTVIKIVTLTATDIDLTGLNVLTGFATPMDAHGLVVWLYPTTGDVTLKHEDLLSFPQNRFRLPDNNDVDVRQYEMIRLMYDGEMQRWVRMGTRY
ncbi:MAG: hypothetical protein HKM28_08215 [Flavobacteriaceae bacterium]|nr:hypothetical protein [Flavobacteriaceae bacterium]